MNYKERIDRVADFIGLHLDEDLTLEKLSHVACFPPYHFHRLFTAHTGLSLKQYIRWLRLKRAAHQLTIDHQNPIIGIALDAGFDTHESFTRAFKRECGLAPQAFRKKPCWDMWRNPPYVMTQKGDDPMNVMIKDMPEKRLAVVEHRGDYRKLDESLKKLITWAQTQSVDLKPKQGSAFGFGYDDPYKVAPEEFRFDLALAIPESLTLKGDIIEKRLPEGRYAVALHKGSRKNIGETVYALYRDWLPESGEELGDFPCVFSYHNFEYEVAETELLTDVCLLLKEG